jgi:hypothetical protein
MINARPWAAAVATTVVAGLLTLVGSVAPATAAASYDTHVVLTMVSTGEETYSAYPQAQVYVDGAPSGTTLPSGPMQLQRRDAGSLVWQTVATGSSSHAFGAKPEWFLTNYTGNATYRVYYAGGEDGWGSGTTWKPSYSNEVSVQVYRHDVGVPHNRGARAWIEGTLTNWAHQRVLVQQKRCRACAWHVYARPRTDAGGHYKLRVATSRKGLHYRVTVKASTQFLKTRSPVLQARIL